MCNKIYILSDMHFGVRNNSVSVNDVIVEYFDWFIGKVNSDGESRDTRTLFVLGDVFNSRVSVNFMILQSVFDVFNKLSGLFSEIYVIAGNHDCYYLDNNSITSISFLGTIPGVTVIESPMELDINGKKCLMFPWEHNPETAFEFIDGNNSDYLFCHMEINGMKYANGQKIENNITHTLLSKYVHVYSGHIHKRQEHGNVTYVGTPYQIDLGDIHDVKGFYILDKDFNEIFVENTVSPFFESINISKILENDVDTVKKMIDNAYVDVICNKELYNNFNLRAFQDKLIELGISFRKMSFYPESGVFYENVNNETQDTSVLDIRNEAVEMFKSMKKSDSEIKLRMEYFDKIRKMIQNNGEEGL